MTKEELAREIAKGLVNTGVEGGFNAVSCSTAGDYPSIGCSQWEGGRAESLLSSIPGGDYYAGRTYSDIEAAGELDSLAQLLDSQEGQDAQIALLAEDTATYVDTLQEVETLDDSRCTIYAGIWCPTSHYVVSRFLQRRQDRGYDLRSLVTVRDLFHEQYASAASCEDYATGYANRADNTFDYVASLDLSAYGVPVYEENAKAE